MGPFRIKKQTLWRIHSVLGLAAGLGLLLIGVTGSLLMFSKEIDGALRPDIVRVPIPPGGDRLPLDELIGRVASTFPGHHLTGWVPGDDPGASDQAWMKAGDREHWQFAHVDPYTGRILSRPAETGEHFTGWILELHYTLLADHVGMTLAGIFALFLFLLGLSGLWLYRDFFRHLFRLRWGHSTRILFSDLHKFVGIHSVIFNLILGFTGAWWNLTHVIGHLVEGAPPAGAVPVDSGPPPSEWASLDSLMEDSEKRIRGFEANYIALPNPPVNTFALYGVHGDAGPLRSPHGSRVTYGAGGDFREAFDIRAASVWGQFSDSFVPLHFGTFGGWPVRLLWCLGGLAPGTLAVSGFTIWWSRRKKARPRRLRPTPLRANAPAALVTAPGESHRS